MTDLVVFHVLRLGHVCGHPFVELFAGGATGNKHGVPDVISGTSKGRPLSNHGSGLPACQQDLLSTSIVGKG